MAHQENLAGEHGRPVLVRWAVQRVIFHLLEEPVPGPPVPSRLTGRADRPGWLRADESRCALVDDGSVSR